MKNHRKTYAFSLFLVTQGPVNSTGEGVTLGHIYIYIFMYGAVNVKLAGAKTNHNRR